MELVMTSKEDAVKFNRFIIDYGLQDSYKDQEDYYLFSIKEEKFIEVLVQFIIQVKRRDFLETVLIERFHYEDEKEREQIIEIVQEMCNGNRHELTALSADMDEYAIVSDTVKYFQGYREAVFFDSLLMFRLKKYYEILINYLYIAIDEYKMEQEYQVFIDMLRDYLKQRKPRKKTIYLLVNEQVRFFDENLKELDKDELDQWLDRSLFKNKRVYIDSQLIAPLLSMAPKTIHLFIDMKKEALIRTLLNIFEERLSLYPHALFPQ